MGITDDKLIDKLINILRVSIFEARVVFHCCRCVVADVMIQSVITKITLLRQPGAGVCCEMPLASLHPNKHKYTRYQIHTNMTLHGRVSAACYLGSGIIIPF